MKSGGYRTEFSLFLITALALVGMLYFNDIIKYIRINELKIFLQRLNKEENTLEAYDAYLKEYPQGKYILQALEAKESLQFNEARRLDTIQAFDRYLKIFPNGVYLKEARYQREQ